MAAFERIAILFGSNGEGPVSLTISSGEIVEQITVLNNPPGLSVSSFPFVATQQLSLPFVPPSGAAGSGFYINPNGSVFQLDNSNFSAVQFLVVIFK